MSEIDFPATMEVDRHVQKQDALKQIMALDWVCCMDCGLLIEKKRQGKPQWSVCPACTRVYGELKHSWLAKMLASRFLEQQKGGLEQKNEVLTKNKVYFCNDCRKFYLDLRMKDGAPTQCRWCFIYEKKTGNPLKARREQMCVVCFTETKGQAICDTCFSKMSIVKKSMEYAYFVTWLGKYMREPVFEAGKMNKQGLKAYKASEKERIKK